MTEIMHGQIPFIITLQKFGALVTPMKLASLLGSEEFFLLLLPFVYLCVSARAGLRLGFLILGNDSLCYCAKVALHLPRPYWFDRRVIELTGDTSYGLPSSHAQNAMAVWLYLAHCSRRLWALAVALILIAAICLSRVYLGVHFPTDILGGLVLGGFFLLVFLLVGPRLEKFVLQQHTMLQIALALAAGLFVIALGVIAQAIAASAVDPESWAAYATKARSMEAIVSHGGALFGLGAGAALMLRYAPWRDGGTLPQRAGRLLIGLVGVGICYVGLKMLFREQHNATDLIFRFVRYMLMAGWVAFLTPWLSLKLGLAVRRSGPLQSTAPLDTEEVKLTP